MIQQIEVYAFVKQTVTVLLGSKSQSLWPKFGEMATVIVRNDKENNFS